MPVGLARALLPGPFTLTVAVKMTPWPLTDWFADEDTLVVVFRSLTTIGCGGAVPTLPLESVVARQTV